MEDFLLCFLFLLILETDVFYEETVFKHNLQSTLSTSLKLSGIPCRINHHNIVSHYTPLSLLFFFHKRLSTIFCAPYFISSVFMSKYSYKLPHQGLAY